MFWAPSTFTLDDEGVSIVLDPIGDPEDRVVVAAEGCPTRAISVVTDVQRAVEGVEGEGRRADRAVR